MNEYVYLLTGARCIAEKQEANSFVFGGKHPSLMQNNVRPGMTGIFTPITCGILFPVMLFTRFYLTKRGSETRPARWEFLLAKSLAVWTLKLYDAANRTQPSLLPVEVTMWAGAPPGGACHKTLAI